MCEALLVLMWLAAGSKLVYTGLVYGPLPDTKCRTTSDWLFGGGTLWMLADPGSGCSKQVTGLQLPLLPAHMYTGNSTWAIAATKSHLASVPLFTATQPGPAFSSPPQPTRVSWAIGNPTGAASVLPAHQQQASGTTSLSPQPGLVLGFFDEKACIGELVPCRRVP